MNFKDQTGAFFDELSQISEKEKREKEGKDYKRDGKPYSSRLTQDEEPSTYYPPFLPEDEPEVIIGH